MDYKFFNRNFKKAWFTPLDELFDKAYKVIRKKVLKEAGKALDVILGTDMYDSYFFNRVLCRDLRKKTPEEIKKYFASRNLPVFFTTGTSSWEAVKMGLSVRFPGSVKRTLERADKILSHTFNLSGWGEVSAGKKIDWHCDLSTGYRWDSRAHYIDIKPRPGKGDIRAPQELSKFYHAVTLGEAYVLERNENYASEFVSQVSDWIDTNPVRFGVNWSSSACAAVRVCNWIAGYYFFKDSPELTGGFYVKFLKSIYRHAYHIITNLDESPELTASEYLSEITALAYVALCFPEFTESGRWLEFARSSLIREIGCQVYPDGAGFEASIGYHMLSLEFFFYASLLFIVNDADFNGNNYEETCVKIFGKKFRDRLYGMFNTLLYLLKPNGKLPQLGDGDGGRLHSFASSGTSSALGILTLGAVFFNESRFKVKEFRVGEEVLWVFGANGVKKYDEMPGISLHDVKSNAFTDAGWFVSRHGNNYCLISCGSNGQNDIGGHAHNDKLSFYLCVNSRDVLTDPGTYTYTFEPDFRNIFRSTASHNTVVVDGEEQNRFIAGSLFTLNDDAVCLCLKWEPGEEDNFFSGEHYGYKRLESPVLHRRSVRFYKKTGDIAVTDVFEGEGVHSLKWSFMLDPDFNPDNLIIKSSPSLEWKKERAYFSPAYGKKVETVKLTASLRTVLPTEVSLQISVNSP